MEELSIRKYKLETRNLFSFFSSFIFSSSRFIFSYLSIFFVKCSLCQLLSWQKSSRKKSMRVTYDFENVTSLFFSFFHTESILLRRQVKQMEIKNKKIHSICSFCTSMKLQRKVFYFFMLLFKLSKVYLLFVLFFFFNLKCF